MRVLISGVSGNVGKACAKLFLAQGWEVVGVSRSAGALSAGPLAKADLYILSLTIDSDIARLIESQPPFDLIIMAHGVQQGCEIGSPDFVDAYHSVIDGNLTSAVYLTQELIRQGKVNEGGLIVYCSSIQATQTRAGRGPYAVAKAGLEALTRTVAVEQAGRGIRAVALRLGQLADDEGGAATMRNVVFSPEQVEAIRNRTPLPWVKCENIARLCLSLFEQTEMSGCVLDMDSAHSLNIWP